MRNKKYLELISHYEECFCKHGDSHLGVDWPKFDDAQKRYKVMLDILNINSPCTLLDFGCGLGHLLEYIRKKNLKQIYYEGCDISSLFVSKCKEKFPDVVFFEIDILENDIQTTYDYIIANGVFTEKRNMTFDEMWDYFSEVILKLFQVCKKGLAFNLMSKHVDWEREDLFHVPFDKLASFLKSKLSRHFIFRSDYGLYEYTTYVFKEPRE